MKQIFLSVIVLCIISMNVCGDEFKIDLTRVANVDFKDEVAGDGKGGWSDQGPQNDMRSIDVSRTNYGGMGFNIINPAKNDGKAVLVFDSSHFKTGLKTATINLNKPYPKASYLYILHTSCWNSFPAGTQIGSIEVSFSDGTGIFKKIKSAKDISDWWNPSSYSNGRVVFKQFNGSNSVGLFLSKFKIAGKAKTVSEIIFRGSGNAMWIILAATLSNREIPICNEEKIVYTSGKEWKAVDTSDLQIKPGTALDLSSILHDAPAGKHGRVIINKKGRLAFENSPNISQRFKGYNGFFGFIQLKGPRNSEYHRLTAKGEPWNTKKTHENITVLAKLIRLQGYDMIRPQGIEIMLAKRYKESPLFNPDLQGKYEKCRFNPAMMDDIDWLISEMKKNGVYTCLTLGGYGLGFRNPAYGLCKTYAIGLFLGDEELLAHWKLPAEKMLNHVNPYTGIAWKNEPAIMEIEFFNEQVLSGILRLEPDKLPARFKSLLDKKWRAWLRQKYKSPSALAKAWKFSSEKSLSFTGITAPEKGIKGTGPKINDFSIFMRELAYKRVLWYKDIVRKLGYNGLLSSGFNASKQILDTSVQWRSSPVICSNNYSGSNGMSPIGKSKISQNSLTQPAGGYWLATNAQRFADRPFLVTEHAFTFWNKYRHEDGLIHGAYSAFQDFSGISLHQDAVRFKDTDAITWIKINNKHHNTNGALTTFSQAQSPISRANEFLVSCLFRRGDVSKARHRVQLDIPTNFLKINCKGNKAVNNSQSRIALLTGFSVAFPELKKVAGVGKDIATPDLTIFPDVGSTVKSGDWDSNVVGDSRNTKFSMSEFCKQLRASGILKADNPTDPIKGIYQNENGELTIRSKEKMIKVVTPKSEAISMEAGKKEKLSSLTVINSSVPACIAACAMDGKDVKSSTRIVLVYSTDAVNSGMEVSADTRTMYKLGTLPILMKCGKLNLLLKNVNAKKMSLYALGLNGKRKQKLPVKYSKGSINISIDTASLKNGPTPFFELSVQ